MQPPRRPKDYSESILRQWRVDGILAGLTDAETIVLAAQFTGLAIGNTNLSTDAQLNFLELAERAMRSAYVGRVAVRRGFGRPVPAAEREDVQ